MPRPLRPTRWLTPLALLGLVAALAFIGLFLLDWFLWAPAGHKPGPASEFFMFDPETAESAVGNLAQVIAAVLGIVITVVSIVVQLAATRYTPRIADMFFRDRTNLAVLGFFVVAGIDAIWVSLSVTRDFVPRFSIAGSLLLVTASILLMVPYFGYVFDFLDPEKIVARIEAQALDAALGARPASVTVEDAQARTLRAIEQLSDVAVNAVSQKDKLIATGAIDALKELLVSYLHGKPRLERDWFDIGPGLRKNPDFVSMAPESVEDLAAQRLWVEWKVLRQYQAIYNQALLQMPDMNYLVAIDTRYVGDAALEAGDGEALALVVKFFNTYLRATLNAGLVRTAYNVLNQYRQLAEHVLALGAPAGSAPAGTSLAAEVAHYFRYYGQLARRKGLGFVAETAAYDVAALCEHAFAVASPSHDELLRILLTIDEDAETGEHEVVLRGVRKAQVKLATYYLGRGAEAHARAIAADMKDEPVARLRHIREELLAATSRDFWEVIDRGTNFDFLDESRKAQLAVFFGWFSGLSPMAQSAGS